MYLNDHASSVATMPAASAPSGDAGYFSDALPGAGAPTVVTADFLNTVAAELKNAVEGAGLTMDKANNAQLLAAMSAIADGAGAVGISKPFGGWLSPTAGHTTTRVTVGSGFWRDSTNAVRMVAPAPISKDLTAAWAAGDGNGGKLVATALAAGQTWHVHAIYKAADGSVDFGFDTSPTAPTLPAGYTRFRRMGSILLDPSATTIRPFKQVGDEFRLLPRSADYAATSNGSGTPTLRTISTPFGIKVEALLTFQSTGTANTTAYWSGIYDPDDGLPPAFGSATQYGQIRRGSKLDSTSAALSYETVTCRVFTNTSSQVYTFSSDSLDVIAIGVLGWTDFSR